MRSKGLPRAKSRGFILIESIIAIVLGAIVSVVVSYYIVQSFNSWVFINAQKSMEFSNRMAVYRMVRDIRTTNTTANILTFTSSSFSFKDSGNNTITFSQTGTALYRNSDVLAQDIVNPGGLSFSYFDGTGTVTASRDSIDVVNVSLSSRNGVNMFNNACSARLRVQ
jgi:type II secretory pathway pseudopilin PulG